MIQGDGSFVVSKEKHIVCKIELENHILITQIHNLLSRDNYFPFLYKSKTKNSFIIQLVGSQVEELFKNCDKILIQPLFKIEFSNDNFTFNNGDLMTDIGQIDVTCTVTDQAGFSNTAANISIKVASSVLIVSRLLP